MDFLSKSSSAKSKKASIEAEQLSIPRLSKPISNMAALTSLFGWETPSTLVESPSICNTFSKEDCNPPVCEYVEGPDRQYCKMSRKYKSNNVTGRITQRVSPSKEKTVATKKIKNLLKNTTIFMKRVCPTSGDCISFGKYIGEINKIFKGFTTFEYAVESIKSIGLPSKNGFIKEITFEKNAYKAYAILKSSREVKADNLVYEYLVGIKFINRVLKKFPCFVETYGLYFYKSAINWITMSNPVTLDLSVLDGLELQTGIDYNKACTYSKYASILIQHIHGAKSIGDKICRSTYRSFARFELIYIVFIVYHALASLSTSFTHYDLHYDNVLLFEPSPGKYIHYHYFLKDGSEVHFKCSFVPKIIDYGRSFFTNGNVSSKTIYDKICASRDCINCGKNNGFIWLDPVPHLTVSSQKKNESHDLRLLISILLEFVRIHLDGIDLPTEHAFVEFYRIISRIVYGVGITNPKDRKYGSRENLNLYDDRIANVTSVYNSLKRAILKPEVMEENEIHFGDNSNKLGDFNIYEDGRDMEYVSL